MLDNLSPFILSTLPLIIYVYSDSYVVVDYYSKMAIALLYVIYFIIHLLIISR